MIRKWHQVSFLFCVSIFQEWYSGGKVEKKHLAGCHYTFIQPLHYRQDVIHRNSLSRVNWFEFRVFLLLHWLPYQCCILTTIINCNDDFNKQMNTLLYKNISLILYFQKGLVCCLWEMSWRQGQTAILTQVLPCS